MPPRRSEAWIERQDLDGFLHRTGLKAAGYAPEAYRDRPIIGICNSWSEMVHCNVHLRGLAAAVKRGVMQAGGLPIEFPVISLSEPLMKPTTMLYRNLMAMDVEESIRAYPLDGVVLLTGCDKTNPASIMGAASADIPSIVLTGGPSLSGHWRGQEVGSGGVRPYEDYRSGRITRDELEEIEAAMTRSNGHCMSMGTASTMACMTEALGLTLPSGAAIPAVDSRRSHLAERTGRQIIDLVERDIKPSDILTREAFENAIRVLQAISGSTNAVVHLLAYAGRVGVDLPVELFDELGSGTPWLADIKPAGERLMEDFFYAGGLPAVMKEIQDLLHLDALTVTGASLGESIRAVDYVDRKVIRSREEPLREDGSLIVLRGNLCPDSAVMKVSAADPRLLRHEGRAIVFEGLEDMANRIHDPGLDVDEDSVLVLRGGGPVGAPGMPEWGHIPIPTKLLKQGVTDMVRISDTRMSGTSFGTIVLHVAPEAAVGGPLALVEEGDVIRLDVEARRVDLLVDEEELSRRRAAWRSPANETRGYTGLYREKVLQANEGCDFDFLRGKSEVITDPRQFL